MRRRPVVVNTRRGPGLVGTMAKTAVVAGTATATVGATKAVMGGGKKQSAAEQQAAQQQAYEAGAQDAAAQAAAEQAAAEKAAAEEGSSLDQQLVEIQKLSVLKDQGLLTEEEFAAKKAQILGI